MLEKNTTTENKPLSERLDGKGTKHSTVQKSGGFVWGVLRGIVQLCLMVAILGGAFFMMQRLIASKPEKPERPIFPSSYTVETIIAKTGDYQPKISLYGETVAGRSVELRSLVSGQVISVSDKLKSGGMVQKGESLVEIDRFNYEGQLREAKANETETIARVQENEALINLEKSRLATAKEQLVFADKDLQRIKELRNRGTATAKQVEDKELVYSQRAQTIEQSEINIIAGQAKLAQQQAALQRLQWRIEQSQRNLNDTVLIAPFNGTISSSKVQAGKLVGANDVLVSMYQTDLLDARFVLTDERFGRLQADKDGLVGREVEVSWVVGGKKHNYKAKIDRIGAEIASARGGVEVFATIEQSISGVTLRPGAFVEISLPDQTFQNHIRLPDTALYNGDTVYISVNKKLVGKKVEISAYDGEEILIGSGIAQGDEVLTTRISAVSDGLRIRKEGDPVRVRGRRNANNANAANGENAGANQAERGANRQRGEGRPNGQRRDGTRRDGTRRNGRQTDGAANGERQRPAQ